MASPFERSSTVFSSRQAEADAFYRDLFPLANDEDHRIARQALAGMIWTKQFFHYDVERWLKGDLIPPPATRRHGRNAQWKHLKAADVISMPDVGNIPGSRPGICAFIAARWRSSMWTSPSNQSN